MNASSSHSFNISSKSMFSSCVYCCLKNSRNNIAFIESSLAVSPLNSTTAGILALFLRSFTNLQKYLESDSNSFCIRLMYELNNSLCSLVKLSLAALYVSKLPVNLHFLYSLLLMFFKCLRLLLYHGG